MKAATVVKLTAVGIALLLLPRRSSRQADTIPSAPSAMPNPNDKMAKNSKARPCASSKI